MATKKPSAPGKTTKAEPKSSTSKAAPNKAAATKGKDVKSETKTTKAAVTNPAPKAAETKTVAKPAVETKLETKTAKVTPAKEVATATTVETNQVTEKKTYTPEEVALRAYFLWVERGYTHGGDVSDWIRAEAELNQQN